MRLLFILIFQIFIVLFIGCGKKADPMPKSTLSIPKPDDVSLEIIEEGVRIINPSSEYKVVVERKNESANIVSFYTKLAVIGTDSNFIDNTTGKDEVYVYRLRNYLERYGAYSTAVSHVISYKGKIDLKSVRWEIRESNICVNVTPGSNTSYFDIFLNGSKQDKNSCFKLPYTSVVILMVVPYSENGDKGIAYSEEIKRDLTKTLLPPQNIKIIHAEGNRVALSWDNIAGDQYLIKFTENANTTEETTRANIISKNIKGCAVFEISTIRGNKKSPSVKVETCNPSVNKRTDK